MLYNGFSDKNFYTRLKIFHILLDEGYKKSKKLTTQLSKLYPDYNTKSDVDKYLSDLLGLDEFEEFENALKVYTGNYPLSMEEIRYDNILKNEIAKDFTSDIDTKADLMKYISLKDKSKGGKILKSVRERLNNWISQRLYLLPSPKEVNIFTVNATAGVNDKGDIKAYLTHRDINEDYLNEIAEYTMNNLFDIPGITVSTLIKNQYLEICSNLVGNIYIAFALLSVLIRTSTGQDKEIAKMYYTTLLKMLKDATDHKKSLKEYYQYDIKIGTPVVTNKFIALGNRDDTITIVVAENPESDTDIASGFSSIITIDKNDYQKFTTFKRLKTSEYGILMTGTSTVWSKIFGDSLKPKDGNYNNIQSSNAI